MQGPIALMLRILFYNAGGALAATGVATWDEMAGTLTIDVDALALVVAGALVSLLTFAASRLAKRIGGLT